jgi:hypothetical protein
MTFVRTVNRKGVSKVRRIQKRIVRNGSTDPNRRTDDARFERFDPNSMNELISQIDRLLGGPVFEAPAKGGGPSSYIQ